jgi:protein SPT2
MTFKKLLKEAAKVDPSTFKVGPKVKVQAMSTEKSRLAEKPRSSTNPPTKANVKPILPSRPPPKAVPPRSQKSVVDKSLPSTRRPTSQNTSNPLVKHPSKTQSNPPITKSGGTDTKSRLRDSFIPNQLTPLSQGPKRDLRTIEEIQNDLWRKKGKNYPSVTGKPKPPTPREPDTRPAKRRHESDDESKDSFISEEEDKAAEFDYRAEIRALFARKGSQRVDVSDDDSDMEASGFEMAREEARAAKLARIEDEEEIRREEVRVREKKRRKMEVEKRKSDTR